MDKTISNFLKWLNKNSGITCELLTLEDNYFSNAPTFNFNAVSIEIMSDTIQELQKTDKEIKKYMNRYGLNIWLDGRYWHNQHFNKYTYSFNVWTAETKAESDNYYYFRYNAVKDIENIIHEYHLKGIHRTHSKELNTECLNIMNHYGDLYNKSLEEVKTA